MSYAVEIVEANFLISDIRQYNSNLTDCKLIVKPVILRLQQQSGYVSNQSLKRKLCSYNTLTFVISQSASNCINVSYHLLANC